MGIIPEGQISLLGLYRGKGRGRELSREAIGGRVHCQGREVRDAQINNDKSTTSLVGGSARGGRELLCVCVCRKTSAIALFPSDWKPSWVVPVPEAPPRPPEALRSGSWVSAQRAGMEAWGRAEREESFRSSSGLGSPHPPEPPCTAVLSPRHRTRGEGAPSDFPTKRYHGNGEFIPPHPLSFLLFFFLIP